jgi:transposase InsO family protein
MKSTTPEPNEQEALIRFKAVNFVEDRVREGWRLAEALRLAAQRPWPDETGRCYAPRTIEDWWYLHKRGGFCALSRPRRRDRGTSRRIDPDTGRFLIEQVCAHPQIDVSVLYERWRAEGRRLPSLRTVYRYLHRQGYDRATLKAGRLESGPTKAFEAPHVNDLWMVDFSPGPWIRSAEATLRTQLCVLIDDHSRLIPFAGYYRRADTEAFLHALREGVLRRGLPLKLYTDRGRPFLCHHTQVVCANLGVRLLHAKPYHSWSKGKIERVIQTIQRGFEHPLRLDPPVESLEELNRKLSVWVQSVYHQRVHQATGLSPEARYQLAVGSIRTLPPDVDVEALFYTRIERSVRKDGTIRIDNDLYEVDLSLRVLRVQVRFDPFTRRRIEVWYQDRLVCLAKAANLSANSQPGGTHAYGEE